MAHQTTDRHRLLQVTPVTPHPTRNRPAKKSSTLPNAIAHNRRSSQKAIGTRSTIDPLRSHLNYTIDSIDDEKAIIERWKGERARLEPRKNACHATELLFTLPANWAGDNAQFFEDCVRWAQTEFGAGNLLSADVHLDEAQPHCHVLFLPIVDRPHKPQAWISPIGKADEVARREVRFYGEVGSVHGFTQPPNNSLNHRERIHLSRAVIVALHQQQAPELRCARWQLIQSGIEHDPAPWCELLGIDIAKTLAAAIAPIKVPSFAGVMTRPQPMEKKHYVQKSPRSFDGEAAQKSKSPSCVGDCLEAPIFTAAATPDIQSTQQAKEPFNWAAKKVLEVTARAWLKSGALNAQPIEIKSKDWALDEDDTQDTFTPATTRERENSILAVHWDCEGGLFNPPPAKQSVKAQYDRMVSEALDELSQHH